jgi:hypothetical protein
MNGSVCLLPCWWSIIFSKNRLLFPHSFPCGKTQTKRIVLSCGYFHWGQVGTRTLSLSYEPLNSFIPWLILHPVVGVGLQLFFIDFSTLQVWTHAHSHHHARAPNVQARPTLIRRGYTWLRDIWNHPGPPGFARDGHVTDYCSAST